MLRTIITVLASFFSVLSEGNSWDSPKSLVQSYINDYQQWNDEAYRLSEAEVVRTVKAMEKAEMLYQNNILSKYCQKGFKGESVAFGSESSHDPEHEVILTEKIEFNKATITTKHTDSSGFVADYEYRLQKNNGRWFLEAVDYVDPDGKYPSL